MRNLLLATAAIALTASGAIAQPQDRGKDRPRAAAKAEVRANARANNRAAARVEARQERRVAARTEQRQERRAEQRQDQRNEARARARADERRDNRQEARAEAQVRARVAERRADDRREAQAQAQARARLAERRADDRREAQARARADERRDNRQENRAEARARAQAAERRADSRRDAVARQRVAERRSEDRREALARQRAAERRIENRREAVRERRQDWREDRREDIRDARRDARRQYVDWRNDRRVIRERNRDYWNFVRRDRARGLINGCPPGLARKWNGCMPPGQVRVRYQNDYRSPYGYEYRPRLFGLSNYYDRQYSGRYYYDDGYLFRFGNSGSIANYIPLLGGALAVGNPWPTQYVSYDVPDYYRDYYDLGAPDSYRYADNVIYRVDDDDAAITAIAALLTGNEIQIGQPMPIGYDVYNVPYPYRDQYYDTPEAYYRYSDGYVYRIDPTTQLVAAAINLLV